MTISTIKMTARQFLELGDDPPGVRLELVDGEVAVSPSPIPGHSYADTQLRSILNIYAKSNDLGIVFGDVDTIFGEYDVRRPDILYFQKSRRHLIGPKAMEGPPNLCIEIISPSSGTVDRKEKFAQYAAGKVRNYWIVDPAEKTLEAYRLSRGKYVLAVRGQGNDTLSAPPFPDLEITLGDLWLSNALK